MAEEAAIRNRRNGSVSKDVLAYFIQYPGQMLHVQTIASDTGLTDAQVRGAVRKFIEDGTTGVWTVNLRGSAWTYSPPKAEREGDWLLVEIVGAIKDSDKKLVRAEDGAFAILTPIDL